MSQTFGAPTLKRLNGQGVHMHPQPALDVAVNCKTPLCAIEYPNAFKHFSIMPATRVRCRRHGRNRR
jgi:hypothetical protein